MAEPYPTEDQEQKSDAGVTMSENAEHDEAIALRLDSA